MKKLLLENGVMMHAYLREVELLEKEIRGKVPWWNEVFEFCCEVKSREENEWGWENSEVFDDGDDEDEWGFIVKELGNTWNLGILKVIV